MSFAKVREAANRQQSNRIGSFKRGGALSAAANVKDEKYANEGGGAPVRDSDRDGMKRGGKPPGSKSPKRLDRKSREPKVNVTIVQSPKGARPGGPPMGGPQMPPPPPPMGGPPPGMAPPPMANRGGRFAKGGAVKMDAGAGGAKGRLEKIKAYCP